MRFSAATQPQQPPPHAPAAGVVQVVQSILVAAKQVAPKPGALGEGADELPAALDERVRLVGEW